MKQLLVTGASGFVGRTMDTMLSESAHGEFSRAWTMTGLPESVDLRDATAVRAAVSGVRPDAVVHLAAQSSVPESFRDPPTTFAVNFDGTYNLLVALRDAGFKGRMLYVSSGDIYGHVPESELPIDELRLPRARSPYAVSKVAAEALCGQWVISEGMDIVIARPFNHIGPGQDRRFVMADFAAQLVAIKRRGLAPFLSVGDVDVTRDFLDIRDVIPAYFALLQKGAAGRAYNVCSGVERSVRFAIEHMARLLDLKIQLNVDATRLRPNEHRRVVGNCSRLKADTGWRPREAFESTLDRLLDYWKGKPE